MNNIEIINASAGSGKTYSLTSRIVDIIKSGIEPESLMATTFTNRAASELHERIRLHLLNGLWDGEVNRISDGFIGTVNSICARLLKEYAIEAGMSPAIEVMPEEDSDSIFNISIDRIIGIFAEQMGPIARRLELDGSGSGYSKNGDWRSDVKRIVDLTRSNQISMSDLEEYAESSWSSLQALFGEPIDADLNKELRDAITNSINELEVLRSSKITTQKALNTLKECYKRIEDERVTWSDWVRLSKLSSAKDGQDYINTVNAIADNVLRHPQFQKDVKELITGVIGCARDALQDYDQYKKEHGLMDFTDQETQVLDLALNNVAFKSSMSDRIQTLMVDEFQDTSPIQLALFLAMTRLAGKSVWVGDPKQAIYGFRGSDPQLMNEIVSLIGNSDLLSYSWRSKERLIEFTNTLFAEVFHDMNRNMVELKVPAERIEKAKGGCLETWYLLAKNNQEEVSAIANGIRDLIERNANVNPGDIAVLCRRNDRCKDIAAQLGKLGTRASVGQGLLMDTMECRLAIAALRYMNNKNDTVSLAEIIRMTTCDNDWYSELMKNPSGTIEAWHDTAIAKALNEARDSIKYWTPLEALEQAVSKASLLSTIKSWPNPKLARSNLDALRGACDKYIDLCSSRRRAATVDGFITYIDESEIEQAKGTGDHTVNVLTYHGSKGLEWPWVVLTELDTEPRDSVFGIDIEASKEFDPTNPLANRKIRYWPWPFGSQKKYDSLDVEIDALPLKSQIRDKAEREEQRLLYVGMTRAKDGLILAIRKAIRDGSIKCSWLNILKDAKGDPVIRFSTEVDDQIVKVGNKDISFGIYRYGAEDVGLPSLLNDDKEYALNFTCADKIYPDARVSPSELPFIPEEHGMIEFEIVEKFTERISIKGNPEMDVLGNAVHSYFAFEYDRLGAEEQIALAQNLLKNWGMETSIDHTELVEAGQRLTAFIDKKYEGYKVYKEWPVSMKNKDGQIIQGFIDFLLDTPSGYVIIDHKSYPGKDVLIKAKEYIPQLIAYKKIVEKATGKSVVDTLLHLPISGLVLRLST